MRLVPGFPPRSERGGSIQFAKHSPTPEAKPKFRSDFPFLADPACPPELKVLASNKITAYHAYCQAHKRLFDCTNLDEQFSTVKQLVENFIENRQIFNEFNHYKEHGRILGVHPIFKELQEISNLRSLSSIELYQKKKKLEHNIWRIEKELSRKGKAELQIAREKRLQQKKNELAEVDRLLSPSTNHNTK